MSVLKKVHWPCNVAVFTVIDVLALFLLNMLRLASSLTRNDVVANGAILLDQGKIAHGTRRVVLLSGHYHWSSTK